MVLESIKMAESHSSHVLSFTIKKSLAFTIKTAHQQAQGVSERWGEEIGPWRGSWNFSCRIFYWILLDFVNGSHVSQTGCCNSLQHKTTNRHRQKKLQEKSSPQTLTTENLLATPALFQPTPTEKLHRLPQEFRDPSGELIFQIIPLSHRSKGCSNFPAR